MESNAVAFRPETVVGAVGAPEEHAAIIATVSPIPAKIVVRFFIDQSICLLIEIFYLGVKVIIYSVIPSKNLIFLLLKC